MLDITGLDETLHQLSRLNVSESLEDKALTKAGKVSQEAIINEANFGNRSKGMIKQNVKLRRPKDGEVIVHTGRAFHAHLIEFGRSAGSTNGSGGRKVSWGQTAPNPFFTRGFGQSIDEAKRAMIAELQAGLGL